MSSPLFQTHGRPMPVKRILPSAGNAWPVPFDVMSSDPRLQVAEVEEWAMSPSTSTPARMHPVVLRPHRQLEQQLNANCKS